MTDNSPECDPSIGTTESERFLYSLCRRSFLRLWTFSNPYRDQGGGKEICDALIVFGNTLVLFSDKSSKFPDHPVSLVAWNRWKRRAIDDSVDQLKGAARWI